MKTIIQFTAEHELDALPIILEREPGVVLRDRVYVLDSAVVASLRNAGVAFEVLSREGGAADFQGAGVGERI